MRALIVTGSVGSGKTAVMSEAAEVCIERGIPHVAVDFDWLCQLYPNTADRFGTAYGLENLTAMWENALRRDITNILIARVLESRGDLDTIADVLRGADLKVVRLVTGVPLMQERVARREIGSGRDWHVARAAELHDILERARPEDAVVTNDDRPIRDVAEDVLRIAGWLT